MGTLLNVEGRLVPPEQAFVPVMDRGFLYGDSVYEVVRTYGGRVFELGRHLDRMERSAARIGLSLPPRARLESELFRTMDAAGNPESYARIIVTRGEGRFGLSPALKTGNYLNSALALRESHAAGADDALLLDLRGQVTEASTSNVFFVQDGVVVTPPLALGMLEGVTRGLVIEIARGEGLLVREEPHGPEALAAADEVFVTSTIREVMPVTSLLLLDGEKPDRRVVAGGEPGPITRRLHAAFRRYVERTHRR